MHKLMEYICGELEEIERKADKGKLSMQEIQYADTLAHMKKNLLKSEEMWDDSEYSMEGGSYARGGSHARGGRGGGSNRGGGRGGRTGANQYGSYAMGDGSYNMGGSYRMDGGYSNNSDMMIEELRDLMEQAPDEKTRSEFHKFIRKIEQM